MHHALSIATIMKMVAHTNIGGISEIKPFYSIDVKNELEIINKKRKITM
jgi:hypothetical protein